MAIGPQAPRRLTCPPKTDPHVKLEWWIEGSQGDDQKAFHPESENPPLKISTAALYSLFKQQQRIFDILS